MRSDDDLVMSLGASGPGWMLLDNLLTAPTSAFLSSIMAEPPNMSMERVFNGYPRARRFTHTKKAGTFYDVARLLHVYNEPATPPVSRVTEVAAWLALRGAGAELARRLRRGMGVPFSEPLSMVHLLSSGERAAQPAHADSPQPWLLHEQSPGVSAVIALHDDTPVTVYPGSHRLFRRLRSLRVPRSEAGDPVHVLLKAGQAIIFRQDLIHYGGAKSAGPDHDRFFFFVYHSTETIDNETDPIVWT